MFQNGGLLVIVAIMVGLWMNEQKLDEAVSMSLLAMVFYIFLSVNMIFYYAMTTMTSFLAILRRVAQVFDLEEHSTSRSLPSAQDEAILKFE